MARRLELTKTGKCAHCGINVYAETNNRPHQMAMPCNVPGCPYETPEQQRALKLIDFAIPPAGKGVTYYE